MKSYTYLIGNQEYNCYNETVNKLADECNGILTKDQLEYAIQVLQSQIRENHYVHSMDTFALILHYVEKENVDFAQVITKNNGWV